MKVLKKIGIEVLKTIGFGLLVGLVGFGLFLIENLVPIEADKLDRVCLAILLAYEVSRK